MHAIAAHSEIKRRPVFEKSAAFYRAFLPLRAQMVALLADTYRRYFKLGLAHPSQSEGDPRRWAWIQLQPAVFAVLRWMQDWYILACDGENQSTCQIAVVEVKPGQTTIAPIPIPEAHFPARAPWRAPSWLFGVSLVFFGIDILKPHHVPDRQSEEKLGLSHSRLLLKGAKRVLLHELRIVLNTVSNEEIAAAAATRAESPMEQRRSPNKRKGWQQREKLYDVIRKVLGINPQLQGIDFCAELDRRHAPPHWDWTRSGEWREGLTWKEAWQIPELQRKIRRVRQEAQNKG